MRKFPQASLPLFKKASLTPDTVTVADFTAFLRQYAFSEAWIFHGIAMEKEGKAIVLAGPSGIGKSTLLRKFARLNMAKPLDDGFVLVGKTSGSYYVVESGLYVTLRTISVLAKCLRIVFRYKGPYLDAAGCLDKDKAKGELLYNLAVLIGSVVAKNRSSEQVISSPVRLATLFLVTHQKDRHPPRRINRGTIEGLNADNTKDIFTQNVSCEVIQSTEQGLKTILYDRIKKSI